MTQTLRITQFAEQIKSGHKVDADHGVIRGVKILGRDSKNGRVYSPAAMSSAATLYEGVRVYLDHPEKATGERTMSDRLGVLRNVKTQADGVYGDLYVLTSHPLAATVLEAAEKMPETLGLSHNAEGQIRREGGKTIVETIERVRSVDLVQNPATVAGLFESITPDKEPTVKTTIRKVLEQHKQIAKPLAHLLEMDEIADQAMEMEPEMAGGDAVKSAFRAAINAVFDDESLDLAATKEKICKLCDAAAEATGDTVTEMDDEETGGKKKEAAMAESHASKPDPQLKQLQEQLAEMKAKAEDAELTLHCRGLLESAKREATDSRLEVLKLCKTDAQRKGAIEDWQPIQEGKPRPTRSAPLHESTGNGQSYAERTKDGIGAALKKV